MGRPEVELRGGRPGSVPVRNVKYARLKATVLKSGVHLFIEQPQLLQSDPIPAKCDARSSRVINVVPVDRCDLICCSLFLLQVSQLRQVFGDLVAHVRVVQFQCRKNREEIRQASDAIPQYLRPPV